MHNPMGIPERHNHTTPLNKTTAACLDCILPILTNEPPIEILYLFGSRAGEKSKHPEKAATAASDINSDTASNAPQTADGIRWFSECSCT